MTGTDRTAAIGAGLILVLVTAVVSGVSTFVNIYAVKGTSSDAFVTIRNLVVAAMLVPLVAYVAISRASRPKLTRSDLGVLAVIGFVGGAVPFLLFFHGLQLATAQHGATTASFFYRTLFLFAGVFGLVALRERIPRRYLAGAALLLGGSYLLLSMSSAVWTDGTVYVLAATVLWAGEYTISKKALRRVPSSTVAIGRMGFGGAFLAGYLALTAQWGAVGGFSSGQWAWVVISAALLTAFVTTWYAGLARVDLSVATAVLVLGYPVTWLLSLGVGRSAFTVQDAAGTVAIFAGAGVVAGLAYLRASWSWIFGRSSRPAPDT